MFRYSVLMSPFHFPFLSSYFLQTQNFHNELKHSDLSYMYKAILQRSYRAHFFFFAVCVRGTSYGVCLRFPASWTPRSQSCLDSYGSFLTSFLSHSCPRQSVSHPGAKVILIKCRPLCFHSLILKPRVISHPSVVQGQHIPGYLCSLTPSYSLLLPPSSHWPLFFTGLQI